MVDKRSIAKLMACASGLCWSAPVLSQQPVAAPPPQAAQQTAAPDGVAGRPSAEATDERLADIVVTAQRRTEKLINVPISVSSLGTAELEARGTQNVSELATSVPNVTYFISNGNFSPDIIIRGISSSARNIGFESSLGVYIDGVFTGRSESFTQQLEDIERVEVLRGPQGTLFGKNTTSGAINITTRRPGDTLSGYAIAEYGNFDAYRLSAGVGGPIVPGIVAAKISGFAVGHDGFYHNVNTVGPARFDDDRSRGARGEIRLTPGEGWDVAIRGDWSRSRAHIYEAEVSSIPPDGNAFGLPEDSVVPGARMINVNNPGINTRSIYGGSLTADYKFDSGLTLTSVTANRRLNSSIDDEDIDSTSLSYLTIDYHDRTRQFTQEFRLTSPTTGALQYVVGAYYYRQRATSRRDTPIGVDGLAVLQAFGIPDSLLDPNAISTQTRILTQSVAGFANGSLKLTDRLSLLGGLRVTHEEKRLRVAQQVPAFLALPGVLGPDPVYLNLDPTRDKQSKTDLSPTAGLQYKLGAAANLYARYSKGFKSGGWNAELLAPNAATPTLFDPRNIRFGPESIENYEIGAKAELLDRRLRVNAALFWQNYRDIQITRFVGGLLGYATDNAGKARSRGAELEVTALAARALELTANIGFTDAKYLRYTDGCGSGCNLDGTRLNAPRWNVSLSSQYTPRLTDDVSGLFRIDYSYRSGASGTGDLAERLTTRVGHLSLVDVRVGATTRSGLEINLFARNLFKTDKVVDRALVTNLALFGISQQNERYNEPRTYGVRAAYRF